MLEAITFEQIGDRFGPDLTQRILLDMIENKSPTFRIGMTLFCVEELFDHEPDHEAAWDCDPYAALDPESYDQDLDLEMDKTDWQVLCLDRFGDRNVNPSVSHTYIMNGYWA